MRTWSLPRREHRGDDRRAGLERALLRVHGGMLLTFIVVSAAPLLQVQGLPVSQVVPRVLILVAFAVVTVDLQIRGERLVHLALLLVPLLASSALEATPAASDAASGLTVGALAISAARQLRPWGYLGFMVPAGLAHVGARWLVGQPSQAAVSDVVLGIGMSWAVYAFVESLYVAATRSADADAATRRQREAAGEEEAGRRAKAAAGRALHDEVLVALRLIAAPGSDPERVREASGHAAESVAHLEDSLFTEEPTGEDTTGRRLTVKDLVWELERRATVGFAVDISGSAARSVLPQHIFDACLRATGEALRNVARHSGVTTAEVWFALRDGSLEVTVVDHGAGIPEGQGSGYGMSMSIHAPVESVGGTVDVRPTPDGGVTVALTLPVPAGVRPSVLRREYELTVRAVGSARPIMSITWPVAIVWVYIALRYSFAWPHPEVSLLLAVAHVAATALVLHRVTRRAPTPWWLVGAAGGLLALDAASLALLPAGSLLDYRSWTLGFIAVPLVALVMVLPLRAALLVHLPHVGLLLAAAHLRPELSDGMVPVGSLNAVLATPVAAFVLGRLMGRLGRQIEREEKRAARLSAVRAARASMSAVDGLYLLRARDSALPWLKEIAAGEVDPSTPAARERAQLLAAAVRDDLYAPGFMSGPLLEVVTDFRRRGGTFTIRPSDPLHASVERTREVLARMVAALDEQHRVTVTLLQGAQATVTGARVAVVPAVPWIRGTVSGCEVESDDYRTAVITLAG